MWKKRRTKGRIHRVLSWQGLELVVRVNSVDRPSAKWVAESLFWRKLEASPIREDDYVVDLGAHIGAFSVLAASKRKPGRVFAFEPDLESLRLCRVNALLNGLEGRITCVGAAVGGTSGNRTLYESTENWGHTLLERGGPANVLTGREVEVACYSLADALAHVKCTDCAFLKFNTEGAEFDMIEQASADTLRRVRAMVGEVHHDLVPRSPDAMLSRLRDAGFRVELIPANEARSLLWATQE